MVAMSENNIIDRVVYLDDPEKFRSKVVKMNGELMEYIPTHYKRTFRNETGGMTTEFSLKPFPDNETATESYPR